MAKRNKTKPPKRRSIVAVAARLVLVLVVILTERKNPTSVLVAER